MRKYNKYLLAGLVLSLLSFSTNVLADEDKNLSTSAMLEYNDDNNDFSANGVVERDNDFCISGKSKDYWKKINFSIDSYSVTSGQPFSGINPKNQPSDKTCVRVRSGRKASQDVVGWANSHVMYTYPVLAVFSPSFMDYDEMYFANFAFTGTLTLTNKKDEVFSCKNVLIGQSNDIKIFSNIWFSYSNIDYSNLDQWWWGGKNYLEIIALLQCNDILGNQVSMTIRSGSGKNSSTHNTFKVELQ